VDAEGDCPLAHHAPFEWLQWARQTHTPVWPIVLSDPVGLLACEHWTSTRADGWHERFSDPTLADPVLDRLVHNAFRLTIKGESRCKAAPLETRSLWGIAPTSVGQGASLKGRAVPTRNPLPFT
jgi:hypothetical protein